MVVHYYQIRKGVDIVSETGLITSGHSEMHAKLEALKSHLKSETRQALHDEAQLIIDDAKTNYVPIEHGDLAASGRVVDSDNDNDLSVQLTFGDGVSEPYALAIHEHPSPHDPPTWKGTTVNFKHGGPKYLYTPMLKAAAGLAERVARRIKLS